MIQHLKTLIMEASSDTILQQEKIRTLQLRSDLDHANSRKYRMRDHLDLRQPIMSMFHFTAPQKKRGLSPSLFYSR